MTVWIFRTASPRKYKDEFIIAINSLKRTPLRGGSMRGFGRGRRGNIKLMLIQRFSRYKIRVSWR
jgi:hypothetical protein